MKIKKVLMAVPYFLLRVLYVIITMQKRNEYMASQGKGMKCIGSKDTSWILPGTERTYYFDPSKKPERDYTTWGEFWKGKGYLSK
jgi:hypothetical protein